MICYVLCYANTVFDDVEYNISSYHEKNEWKKLSFVVATAEREFLLCERNFLRLCESLRHTVVAFTLYHIVYITSKTNFPYLIPFSSSSKHRLLTNTSAPRVFPTLKKKEKKWAVWGKEEKKNNIKHSQFFTSQWKKDREFQFSFVRWGSNIKK